LKAFHDTTKKLYIYLAKFIAIIMLSTINNLNLFLSRHQFGAYFATKNIIIPIWSLKGHHIWASFLPTTSHL
jgi:hypothetical protein